MNWAWNWYCSISKDLLSTWKRALGPPHPPSPLQINAKIWGSGFFFFFFAAATDRKWETSERGKKQETRKRISEGGNESTVRGKKREKDADALLIKNADASLYRTWLPQMTCRTFSFCCSLCLMMNVQLWPDPVFFFFFELSFIPLHLSCKAKHLFFLFFFKK